MEEETNPHKWEKSPDQGRSKVTRPNNPNIADYVWRSISSSIDKGMLDVVFQPIVDHCKNTIFAYETLSRPQYDGRLLPPDKWFQAACECGLSAEVDLLAFSSGVNNFRLLPPEITSVPLFVNVIPGSLTQRSFLDGLDRLLYESQCQPEQLVLEVIEYVSYDPQALFQMIKPLRSLDVRIAIDDVGMGNTNLAALVQLEPDFIKIDRSLIQDIATSSSKQRLLSHLVGYMESGSSVIAEGVENAKDLAAIQEAGVNLSQGYYWARPMSVDDPLLLTTQIEIRYRA